MNDDQFTPHEPLEVEPFFRKFIVEAGGEVISDIVGDSPPFPNADFLFRDDEVIVELKSIEEDFPRKEQVQRKVRNLIKNWLKSGLITLSQANNPSELPPDLMTELIGPYRKPLERVLSKANKQIKATRKHLNLENANGLLFLVNDGAYSVSSDTIIALVGDKLTRHFSGIDGFVYITLNRYAARQGDPFPRLLWAPLYHPSAPDSLVTVVDRLGGTFGEFLKREIGGMKSTVQTSDRSALDQLRFI